MGIRGVLSSWGLDWLGSVVLIVCFVVFLAILVWTLTRSRKEIEERANIPLDDMTNPEGESSRL